MANLLVLPDPSTSSGRTNIVISCIIGNIINPMLTALERKKFLISTVMAVRNLMTQLFVANGKDTFDYFKKAQRIVQTGLPPLSFKQKVSVANGKYICHVTSLLLAAVNTPSGMYIKATWILRGKGSAPMQISEVCNKLNLISMLLSRLLPLPIVETSIDFQISIDNENLAILVEDLAVLDDFPITFAPHKAFTLTSRLSNYVLAPDEFSVDYG